MLDENLPTFYVRPFVSASQDSIVYLAEHGAESRPSYTLRRPDPTLQTSRNCYSVALFDAYNPEILYGEVLVKPEWSQPTLSAEEIRRNGGVAPPPQPNVPAQFTVHLYSPDQQVIVKNKQGSWGGSPAWEFDLPQQTFRQPSGSSLDQSLGDPAAIATTPRLCFRWRKDGKLSKDLICSLAGKSNDAEAGKKKWKSASSKEPDITVSLFKYLKELTVYEPNLYRVDLEDFKGLEVILLLSAAVIRDLYFSPAKETFNMGPVATPNGASNFPVKPTNRIEAPPRASHEAARPGKSPINPAPSVQATPLKTPHPQHAPPAQGTPLKTPPPQRAPQQQPSPPIIPVGAIPSLGYDLSQPIPQSGSRPPRSTTQLPNSSTEDPRERKAREKASEAEQRRVRKMVEAEQKTERRRQVEVDKETERLRKVFAAEQKEAEKREKQRYQTSRPPQQPQRPNGPPQSYSAPMVQAPFPRPQSVPHGPPRMNQGWNSQPPRNYLSPGPPQHHSYRPSPSQPAPANGYWPSSPAPPLHGPRKTAVPKKSFLGLRVQGQDSSKLNKKRSSLF